MAASRVAPSQWMSPRRSEADPDEGHQVVQSLSLSRRVVDSLLPAAALYVIVEIVFTVLYQRGIVEPVLHRIDERDPSSRSRRLMNWPAPGTPGAAAGRRSSGKR